MRGKPLASLGLLWILVAPAAWSDEPVKSQERVQGVKHFEVVNAYWRDRTYRRIAALSREEREEYVSTGDTNQQARSLTDQGKYAAAQPLYEKALEINRRLRTDDHPLTALSYNNLASNLQAQGHYGAARPLQEKALEINRRLRGDNHPDVATSSSNLAGNLRDQGQYAAAQPLFEKALEIRRRLLTDDHPDVATSYNNLAGNLQAQGQHAAAQPLFAKGLELRRQLLTDNHPLTAQSYNNLAYNLYAQGKYREAIVESACAARAHEVNRLDAAVGGLDRATVKPQPGASLLLSALLARLDRGTEAWQRLEQQWGRGRLDELAERQDKRLTREERDRLHTLVTELERLDRLFEAPMANSDQAERRARLDRLRQERDRARIALGELQTDLVKKYGPLAGEVAPLTKVQASLPADTALIAWVDVKPSGPDSADPDGEHWGVVVRAQGDPIWVKLPGTGKDQHWTQDDGALPGRVKNALWDQPRLGSAAWGPLVERLHAQRLAPLAAALAARSDGLPTARRLVVLPSAALSLVPVEALLPPGDPRTISYAPSATVLTYLRQQPHPDASAALLALGDPVFADSPVAPADLGPLPDHGLLVQQLQASARADDDATFARLPGTRFEVAELARLFEDANRPVRVLLDNDANEPELDRLASSGALGKFGFIHLATHGVIDEQFPRRSAVILTQTGLPDPLAQVLAKEPVYDGRLVVREIQRDWDLRAELVTLSACETARGQFAGGEGFVGFTQALLLSGARSVCLSLWKVDDTATALLMRRFYANLLGVGTGRPRPKAEALAEAKGWLRGLGLGEAEALAAQLSAGEPRGKRAALRRPAMPSDAAEDRPYAHPYYWASLVLIGDPD